MNPRGGWALIKNTWTSWMQYRSFFFILAFGWMIPPLVSLFVWRTAAQAGAVEGLNQAQFTAYYLVLILVNQLTYAQTNWTLGDVIREGGLSPWLLRPMSPIYQVLSSEVAGKFVYLVFVVPAAGLLALLLKPELHPDWIQLGQFLLALLLAWALRFLWGFWLALLAFWANRSDSLLALQDALVFLLAGMVAPVALLPPAMQAAARLLPFRYMVGFPVELLTQSLPPEEIAAGFAIQSAWVAVAGALAWVLWKAGIRRYNAVGG